MKINNPRKKAVLLVLVSFALVSVIYALTYSSGGEEEYRLTDFNHSQNATEEEPLISVRTRLKDPNIEEGLVFSSPAKIEFTLESEKLYFKTYSGTYPPFDTPSASKATNENKSFNLWSDDYRKNDVGITQESGYKQIGLVPLVGIEKQWSKKQVNRTYQIRSVDVSETGKYIVEESVSYSNGNGDGREQKLNYSIEFNIEEVE